MWQSNLPLDLKKCLQPPNNQPEWFFSARQRKEKRRKIKWKFSSELLVNDNNDQAKTFKNNNQMYLFTWEKKGGKCKIKDMIYPFNRNEKRKKERKKKDKKKVSVSIAITRCCMCTYLYHVFLQWHIMMMAGGPKHMMCCTSPTRYQYQLGHSLCGTWYQIWCGHHKEPGTRYLPGV